jgi:TolB-like protein/Flp pilus assembly protein TadD
LAGAWVFYEVVSTVGSHWDLPDALFRGISIALVFGFFITLILAWYHGEKGRQKVGWVEAVLLVALLALAGQSIWSLKYRSERVADGFAEETFRFRDTPLPQHSVAVLPCTNLGDDASQGYFADGLAAELITRLAAVRGLRIPSQTSSFSFRGKNVTLEAVAAALKVRHVLECEVFGDESRIRISARLIDAESGYTLWSESFNRSKAMLFDVQEEVARAVVQKLEIRLVDRERLLVGRRWTSSTEAYDQFLRGIKYQIEAPTEDGMSASLKHLERAVELDPQFGRAYARLAIYWLIMGNYGYAASELAYDETERLARKAIELDGDLYEAHWALGWAQFVGKFAWQEAMISFRKVIELAPGNWEGYHSLGFVLGVLGRYEILYTRQRQYDDSIRVTLELTTRIGWTPFLRTHMAWLLVRSNRPEEARNYLHEVEAENPEDVNVQLFLAMVYSLLGEMDKALVWAEPLKQRHRDNPDRVLPGTLAFAYAHIGDYEQAMKYLLEARQREDVELLFLDDSCFDGMRNDPRFIELINGLKLPEEIYLTPHYETIRDSKSI